MGSGKQGGSRPDIGCHIVKGENCYGTYNDKV